MFAHLRVSVGSQIRDNLVGSDTHLYGAAHRLAGNFAGDQVGKAVFKCSEKCNKRDLQRRRGICIQSVVCFDDDESRSRLV